MEFRAALENEKPEIFANVHEVWPHHEDLNEHIKQRLNSPQHLWAQWYVASDGEAIAASLGAYPYDFWIRDKVVKGIAIGAVHTLPSQRRKGLAESLIRFVHQDALENGAQLSLLFSDIAPSYYAKLGYRELSILHGSAKAKEDKSIVWSECSEQDFEFRVRESSQDQIHRSKEHWDWLKRRHQDLKYLRGKRNSELVSEIVCGTYENKFFALDCHHEGQETDQILSSCAHFCGKDEIHYWTQESFQTSNTRVPEAEVPMVCDLTGELDIKLDWRLQPLDHV